MSITKFTTMSLLSKLLDRITSRNTEIPDITKLPKIQQAKYALDRMATVMSISPIKANSLSFKSTDANIVLFYDKVAELFSAYVEGTLTPKDCFSEMHQVNLDRFFTNDGAYVDHESLRHLVKLCSEVIDRLQLDEANDSPNASYAIRLLNKIFNTIIELEKAVSQAKNK